MKAAQRRKTGCGALELIEEAVHLLRMNTAALPAYYIGGMPFVLGLLYFWSDMSRSPHAAGRLAGASLGMSVLFLWMKTWQVVFLDRLRARISASEPRRWTPRRFLRVLVVQTILQPSALLVLPLALLPAALPFPWAYAFYQNVTAMTDGESSEIKQPLRRAWTQAGLWPSQNFLILVILAAFALCVMLNVMSVCFMLPGLLKMLFGIESVYLQSPLAMLNTTLLAAVYGLTYLCLDPVAKTVYLLRCFYGESLKSGEDIRAELKRFSEIRTSAIACLALISLLAVFIPCAAHGENAAPAPAPAVKSAPAISAPQMDTAIDKVMQQSKYEWRLPREKLEKESSEQNVVFRFLSTVAGKLRDWLRDFIKWVFEQIARLIPNTRVSPSTSGYSGADWISVLQAFMFILLAGVVSVLVIMLIRAWQRRRQAPPILEAVAVPVTPDLQDENVSADQLPEDGWIKLGGELLAKGEMRLALRAFYLASLAHLASRNLLTIAKFKSNCEYHRELGRRGHALPEVLALFGENVNVFDRAWYGLHNVDPDMAGRFLANVERIKTT